ncbi:Breast carcinoma-amplified sequence 4 [Varanus komodoensis]|nr:Breast carcinoma-amplified sequence 4 [Varanus komodoensis]
MELPEGGTGSARAGCGGRSAAARLALRRMKEVEECVEEMLIRLDEFCGMTDMIRRDTFQLLDKAFTQIKAKLIEMNNIYIKAFVKMAGQYVSSPEEQVLQAEKAYAIFP